MKRILLFALAALVAFPQISDAKKKDSDGLKVMSYNIRYGSAEDGTNSWKYRWPATIEMLNDVQPDVFGVQEALDFQLTHVSEMARNYKNVGVGREDGKHDGEHMAIFWNKKTVKMLKWGTFWLSETPEKPSMGWDAACFRTATWALMKDKKTGKKFYFVNTHLDHVGKEARKLGLKLIVDRIDDINPEKYPMVLTGDFNVRPDNPCLVDLDKIMTSTRKIAKKTDSKGTFNGWRKDREGGVIDYIYVSGFGEVVEYETITKKYADRSFISDHYPIMSVLKF
jgi:endonuclease/exonuclease/phosphatase family metal-dependent hydrolase